MPETTAPMPGQESSQDLRASSTGSRGPGCSPTNPSAVTSSRPLWLSTVGSLSKTHRHDEPRAGPILRLLRHSLVSLPLIVVKAAHLKIFGGLGEHSDGPAGIVATLADCYLAG